MAESGPETMIGPLSTDRGGPGGERLLSCQVWIAEVSSTRSPRLTALLDDVEQQRRARYAMEGDKDRFTVAAALLRLVVARETGLAPGGVRIDRTCHRCPQPHGKPQVVGADLHVSISHSGDRVALAVTREAPIGVDVEVVADRDVTELARTVLGAAEPVRRRGDFYTYWCRKEAIVKATGEGLQVPLIEVIVRPADGPAGLVTYRGAVRAAGVADLPMDGGYAGAVAVLAEGTLDVRMRDAADILPSPDR